MKRIHRIGKKEDFASIFKEGRFINGSFMLLKTKKTDREYMRLGILVGHKISKRATARNKLKRQLREIFGKYASAGKTGIDIIVMPKPEIVTKSFKEIKEEAEGLLRRIGISV